MLSVYVCKIASDELPLKLESINVKLVCCTAII